jgi:hypothetical protein
LVCCRQQRYEKYAKLKQSLFSFSSLSLFPLSLSLLSLFIFLTPLSLSSLMATVQSMNKDYLIPLFCKKKCAFKREKWERERERGVNVAFTKLPLSEFTIYHFLKIKQKVMSAA